MVNVLNIFHKSNHNLRLFIESERYRAFHDSSKMTNQKKVMSEISLPNLNMNISENDLIPVQYTEICNNHGFCVLKIIPVLNSEQRSGFDSIVTENNYENYEWGVTLSSELLQSPVVKKKVPILPRKPPKPTDFNRKSIKLKTSSDYSHIPESNRTIKIQKALDSITNQTKT